MAAEPSFDARKSQKRGAKARAARWREENRAAIESANVWIEANGLPLEKYRLY